MLTSDQARQIVHMSIQSVSGNVNPNNAQTLQDAGIGKEKLGQFIQVLSSDSQIGVVQFQHSLDPNIIGHLNSTTFIDALIADVARLSMGKLCTNPVNPHPQQCCPYPAFCPVCGRPVL